MIPFPSPTPPAVTARWSAALAAVMFVPLLLQDFPNPFSGWSFVVWAVLTATYVAVETFGRSGSTLTVGGSGWPVLVAMVVVLDPDGALLGAGLAVTASMLVDHLVATFADGGRRNLLRRPGDRFLAAIPPLVVVALSSATAGHSVAGGSDGAIALIAGAGALAGVLAHVLAHRVVPSLGATGRSPGGRLPSGGYPVGRDHTLRPVVEAAAMGTTAALLGVLVSSGGWVALPLGIAGLLVVSALEYGNRRLAGAEQATIASLLLALEAKDLYTRGHAVRVAELTALIADEMGLPPARAQRLVTAALLHDIGKIATPRHLLRKPGRLTPAEYARVQEHAVAAERLLGNFGFLDEAVTIVSEHHLHVDGGGYGAPRPDGTSLEARIVAVADCFDAMTSHRPYRRALSRAYACAELRRSAGTQFDPDVVEALIRRLDDLGEVPTVVGADSDEEARRWAELEMVR